MAEDEDKDDSRRMEAFDLVTEALEKIDAHQQSVAAHGRSAGKDLLISAEGLLSEAKKKAKKEDPEHFKAEYFQAMVTYLRSGPGPNGEQIFDVIAEFRMLLESVNKDWHWSATRHSLAQELNYNLAAALFESKQYSEAITLFEETAGIVTADLEVRLLAHAGAALAHATRAKESDDRKLKEHANFIHNELWPPFFPPLIPLVRRLRRKKPIDNKVANKVREIIKLAENASERVSPSDGEEPDKQEKVHT